METWKGKRTYSGAIYNSDAMSLATTDTTIGRAKASTRVRRSDEEDGKKKREKQNACRSAEGTKRKRGNASMSHQRLEGNDKNAHEDAEQLYNLDGEKRTQETDTDQHGRSISDKVEKSISGKSREKKGANSEQNDVAEDFEKFDDALGESVNARRSRDGRIGSSKLMSKNGTEEISVRLSYKTVNELDNHVKAGSLRFPGLVCRPSHCQHSPRQVSQSLWWTTFQRPRPSHYCHRY